MSFGDHSLRGALLLAASLGFASAQAPVLDDPTATWALTWENDSFFGLDENYTSGLRLSYLSGNQKLDAMGRFVAASILKLDTDPSRLRVRRGFSIAQEIYTPRTVNVTTPLPDEHPYAGYLYGRFTRLIEQVDRVDEVSLDVGIVGPSALGQQAQDFVHNIFGREEYLGWDNQIDDTPAVNISYARQRRVAHSKRDQGIGWDCIVNGGFSFGTVETAVRGGANVRIGQNLRTSFGPPRVRPSTAGSGFFRPQQGLSWYVFGGGEVSARAHNIFLDGSLFRDDDPSVEKQVVIADVQSGAAIQLGRTQLTFTYVVRTQEFATQDVNQQFGAFSIARRF
ncbi:MAG: lipid A deacylase LpxR family protein [Pseudomonadota bacterium]